MITLRRTGIMAVLMFLAGLAAYMAPTPRLLGQGANFPPASGGSPSAPATSVQTNQAGVFTGYSTFEYTQVLGVTLTAAAATDPAITVNGAMSQSVPLVYFKNTCTATGTATFNFCGNGLGDAGDGSLALVDFTTNTVAPYILTFHAANAPAGEFAFLSDGITSAHYFLELGASNSDESNYPLIVLNAGTGVIKLLSGDSSAGLVINADHSATLAGGLVIGGGTQVKKVLSSTATLDFGNLAALGCEDLSITVTGALDGDQVDVATLAAGYPSATSYYTGFVASANTVTVRYCALVSGNPPSQTYRATVTQY